MTAPAIALMILTILLVWGGLVASVVLLQVLSVPSDEETKAAQEAIEAQQALRDQKERYEAYRI
ncbi:MULTISPECIES: methionine/alanine import family NSS transporter small subunit [Actinomycetaceae]|uniref:methionine/alanine import family NSS transporter small subunit n=1 Tax=Actinomycetaceae TaxID=2049 RepID=UPI0003F4C187|nr:MULTISPECIES: methionine/alanine import family NSS transporter small subunit [Actinomycetaceae]MBF0958947.1 methionine/alanine import family NSS transporter small subunit [Actinomyces sp.]WLD78915.1 methionine/alanine import family NSS transporter small subunit [Schaalia sp. HMT-172]